MRSRVFLRVGDVFGYLKLTGDFKSENGKRYYECECICGNKTFVLNANLKNGGTKSCGCRRLEFYNGTAIKSGHSVTGNDRNHPIYRVWTSMKDRCYIKKAIGYKDYGGRGVYVCPEWKHSFKMFYTWAVENGWKKGLRLDKDIIPKKLGIPAIIYSPETCCFVTITENNRNKRNNHVVEIFGEKKCLSEWVEDKRVKVSINVLIYRLKNGYPPEVAIKKTLEKQKQ